MTEKDVYHADLRHAARILKMKARRAHHKAENPNDPFAIYHFAQALAYEEAVEVLKHVFRDEMEEEDWE